MRKKLPPKQEDARQDLASQDTRPAQPISYTQPLAQTIFDLGAQLISVADQVERLASTDETKPANSNGPYFFDQPTGKVCRKCKMPVIYRIEGTGHFHGKVVMVGHDRCACGERRMTARQRKFAEQVTNIKPIPSEVMEMIGGVR